MSNLWIIKDALGRVAGPYETQDVLIQIKNGALSGDEQIASYPEGAWREISSEPEFFDYMLSILAGTEDALKAEQKEETELEETYQLNQDEPVESPPPAESEVDLLDVDGIEPIFSSHDEHFEQSDLPQVSEKKIKPAQLQREAKGRSHLFEDRQTYTVDKLLEIKEKEKKTRRAKKQLYLLFVIAVGLGLGFFLVPKPKKQAKASFHFVLPEKSGQSVETLDAKNRALKKALLEIKTDLVPKLRSAQTHLNGVLSFEPRNKLSLELLCNTYFRLWDFTGQSSRDLNVVSNIAKRAYGVGSNEGVLFTCRLTEMILRDKMDEANQAVDSYLNTELVSKKNSYSLRFFKGYLLHKSQDYNYALSFLESSVSLEPNWIPSLMLLASVYTKLNRSQDAYNTYRRVLKISPQHPDALFRLASLNIEIFSKFKMGQKYFNRAVEVSKLYPPQKKIESQAYSAMAKMHLKQNDRAKAEAFAKKAFEVDSSNIAAKNILVSTGSKTEASSADKYILSEADSLYNSKNWLEAATYYVEAYSINSKNGLAALRAAKCKWELGFVKEAIQWGELAVAADPRRLEAYITLAEFLTSQFRLVDAGRVLMKARSLNPKSFEVYRGFAKIESLRKNYESAIRYAEKALKIYSNDVESIAIIVEAYKALGDMEKAFAYARTAMEVSRTSFELEDLYAELLMITQGLPMAEEYIEQRSLATSGDLKYRIILANIYLKDQQYRKAATISAEVNQLVDGDMYQGLLTYAQSISELGKADTALDYYQRAYLLKPTDISPLFESGLMLLKLKKPQLALKQFERVRNANPNYPDLEYQSAVATKELALKQRKTSLAQESISLAQKELKKNPVHHESYILIAENYYILGGILQSKVESTASQNEDYSELYSSMVSWYKLCAKNYQKAIEIAIQPASVYIDMARCYRLSGSLDQAQASAQQAEKLDVSDPRIWIEIAQIYEQQGNFIAALRAYEKFILIYPNAPNKTEVDAKIKELEGITGEGQDDGAKN